MSAAAATTTVTLTLDEAEWTAVRDVLAAALRLQVEWQAATLREAPVGVGPGTAGPSCTSRTSPRRSSWPGGRYKGRPSRCSG